MKMLISDQKRLELEKILNYQFKNISFLQLALVHRSYWNEHKAEVAGHNERLEFLGDAVLNLVVADELYTQLPHLSEGELTRMRAQLVEATACAKYCLHMKLDTYLLLGKGEQLNEGRGRESILADFFEALVGSIFLDGGIQAVRDCMLPQIRLEMQTQQTHPSQNWKSLLQDLVQKQRRQTPVYQILEESGPDHHRYFRVAVLIEHDILAEGEGPSKKEAQVQAAKKAYELLKETGKNHGN
ncbi:MAG: ribonuclease III [Verrucomicrobia bacterium]|nr:ribonuclease III [Verrucomicrobiota bacterium]MBS0645770.1 ribonuclease III [Verrucomicrobiota bacterium]